MQKLKNKIQLTSIDYTKNLNTLKYILTDAKRKFNDQICTGEHFITTSKIHDDFNCLICLQTNLHSRNISVIEHAMDGCKFLGEGTTEIILILNIFILPFIFFTRLSS